MKVPPRMMSGPGSIVCLACGHGELGIREPDLTECGHPEMRRLLDGVCHWPACGLEAVSLGASSAPTTLTYHVGKEKKG